MVSPTVLPGSAFASNARRSSLLIHWRSSDLSLKTVDGGVTGTFTRASLGGLVNGRGQITDAADTDVRLVGPHADNQPRFGVSSDGVPELLLEAARTNLCLRSSEFNNGSWAKTTTTIAADSVAAPDALGTADTLTASAGNGTVIQDLGVIGSAAHTFSIWLKRKTGTGNIQLTLDNGSAWTTKTITDEWAQYSITQTLANPDVGIRIVTNADAIYAWGAQAEAGSFLSSPIPTVGSTVTRAVEVFSIPFTAMPQEMTIYGKLVFRGNIGGGSHKVHHVGSNTFSADPRINVSLTAAGALFLIWDDGTTEAITSSANLGLAIGDILEFTQSIDSAGSLAGSYSINGAGVVAIASAAGGIPTNVSAFAAATASPNSAGTTDPSFGAWIAYKIASGVQTMQQLREAF